MLHDAAVASLLERSEFLAGFVTAALVLCAAMFLRDAVRGDSEPSSEEEDGKVRAGIVRDAGGAPQKQAADALRPSFSSSGDDDKAGSGSDDGFGNHVDIDDDDGRSVHDFLAPVPHTRREELDAHFGALDNMSNFSEVSDGANLLDRARREFDAHQPHPQPPAQAQAQDGDPLRRSLRSRKRGTGGGLRRRLSRNNLSGSLTGGLTKGIRRTISSSSLSSSLRKTMSSNSLAGGNNGAAAGGVRGDR